MHKLNNVKKVIITESFPPIFLSFCSYLRENPPVSCRFPAEHETRKFCISGT